MKLVVVAAISGLLISSGAEAAPKIDSHQKTVVGLIYRMLGAAHICRTVLGPGAYSQAKRDALKYQVDAGIDAAQARTNVSNLDKAVRLEVKQVAPKENKAKCSRLLADVRSSLRAVVAKAKAGI